MLILKLEGCSEIDGLGLNFRDWNVTSFLEQPLSSANLEIDFVLQMPPKTRILKALKASRRAATPSRSANVPSTYPWPNKAEGQPININDPLLLDYNCEGAARYNRLLAAEILPTRFAHEETLAVLGLESDVFDTLDVMGLAPLCYQAQVLYPDLVRQVLATAQISYQSQRTRTAPSPSWPTASSAPSLSTI